MMKKRIEKDNLGQSQPVQAKAQKKTLNAEESKEKYMSLVKKGVIQIKLPRSYPAMFHTWETYKDSNQKEIALLYRKKIESTLIYLHESVKPIARQFELYYSLFTEGHPSIVGYAFTKKIKVLVSSPLEKNKEYLTTYHVYIKLRDQNKPNDSKLFLNRTTAMSIMLHELAHLRCYDHSFNFALLLRDIYKAAIKLNLFPKEQEEHTIPSRRSWERVLFERKGNMTDSELKEVYDQFINNQSNAELDDSLLQEEPNNHANNLPPISNPINSTQNIDQLQKGDQFLKGVEGLNEDQEKDKLNCCCNQDRIMQSQENIQNMDIVEEVIKKERKLNEKMIKIEKIGPILKDNTNSLKKIFKDNNTQPSTTKNYKLNNSLNKLPLIKQKTTQLINKRADPEKAENQRIGLRQILTNTNTLTLK